MRFTANKDVNRHIRQLVRNGWTWIPGRKHNRLIPPDGRGFVTVSTSPGDHRALLNLRRDVRHTARSGHSP
ncbi:MAG: hypothetical protein Q4D19_08625 [Lautropia sp.]|nr:hypothetical protein [Lautropia sp.]